MKGKEIENRYCYCCCCYLVLKGDILAVAVVVVGVFCCCYKEDVYGTSNVCELDMIDVAAESKKLP